jgi:hypothetical protein
MTRDQHEEALCASSERALRVIRYRDELARHQFWRGYVSESALSLGRSYAAGARVIALEVAILRRAAVGWAKDPQWAN